MADDSYKTHQALSDGTSEWNQLDSIIRRVMGDAAHATLVAVVAVDAAKRTVDVKPLVSQIDGAGQTTPHGVVHDLPYITLQGGGNAVLLDPAVGDMGLAVFADQDISSAKANRGPAGPGSRRRFSRADGIYVGGVLNAAPTQYVQFTDGGVTIKSPTQVTVDAPSTTVTGPASLEGNVSVVGNIAASGTISDETGSIDGGGGATTPSATLLLYQRAATLPPPPSAPVYYNFSTGAVTGLTNGWLASPPAPDGNQLWVIQVITREGTAVPPVAWTPPLVLAAPGQPGLPGVQTYTWSAYSNAPDGSVDFTTGVPDTGGITRVYEGVAYNQLTATPSTNPANYVWRQYTGPAAFGLIATGSVVLAGTTVISRQAGTGYGTDSAYSGEAQVGSAYLSFSAGQTNAQLAVGLNSDPTTDNLASSIDYAWVLGSDGTCSITENGTAIASVGTYTTSTVFSQKYDGRFVYYYKDGTLERQIASAAGRALFVDSAFFQAGRFGNLVFLAAATAGTDGAPGAPGPTGPQGPPGAPGAPSALTVAMGSSIQKYVNAGASITASSQVGTTTSSTGSGTIYTTISANGTVFATGPGAPYSPTEPAQDALSNATFTNTTGTSQLFTFVSGYAHTGGGVAIDSAQSYLTA